MSDRRFVWKYVLEIKDGAQKIESFDGAEVIHCEAQDGKLCLWIEVDTRAARKTKTVLVVGTGHPIPEGAYWLGTAVMPPFVWHVYGDSR